MPATWCSLSPRAISARIVQNPHRVFASGIPLNASQSMMFSMHSNNDHAWENATQEMILEHRVQTLPQRSPPGTLGNAETGFLVCCASLACCVLRSRVTRIWKTVL